MTTIQISDFENENHFYAWLATMTGASAGWLAEEFFPAWERMKREGSIEMDGLLDDAKECWANK